MICTVKPGRRRDKRPREWKEMRLAAAQAQGSCEAVYAATFESVGDAGRRWAHCARDAGWGLKSQIHAVADGAEWIRIQGDTVFGDQHHMLCDFYHVSEYLAAATKIARPSRSERWRKTQQSRLKRGASATVIAELACHHEPPDTPQEDAHVSNAYRYLNSSAGCFRRANNWKNSSRSTGGESPGNDVRRRK